MRASGQIRGMLDVVWFKRDLRVADHAALAAARAPVLPLYIVEPEYWRGDDASPRQWHFLMGWMRSINQPSAIFFPAGIWPTSWPSRRVHNRLRQCLLQYGR